jgi:hypothetical protein
MQKKENLPEIHFMPMNTFSGVAGLEKVWHLPDELMASSELPRSMTFNATMSSNSNKCH